MGRRRLAQKWKVLICVVFGIFMAILDTTAVNVAFPTLRAEYGATLAHAQWIVSVYVLVLGVTTPVAGYLADRFGIKRMYMSGLGVFVLGSALSGFAPSLWLLILARGLQGIGGGMALPLGSAQLFNAFPPEERGTAFGIFGVALLVAPALGPIVGGALVVHGLWRWIFFVNVPIGLLGVALAGRWLRPAEYEGIPHLDRLGLLAAALGFGGLLFGASLADVRGWTSPAVLAGFAVGLVGQAAFIFIELRVAHDPLLDLRLYRNRTFLVATVVGYATVLSLFGAEFLLPIYLQSLRGLTALETGLLLLPLAVTAAIVTPIAGRIYDRIGPRALVIVGFSVLVINTWQLSRLDASTTAGWIVFLMILRGFALGCTVQTTFTTALGAVPRARMARGTSLVQSTRYVIQAIGVAVFATVVVSALSADTRRAEDSRPAAAVSARDSAAICIGKEGSPLPVGPGGAVRSTAAGATDAEAVRGCSEHLAGFERAYLLTFGIALAALLIGALLPGWPGEWSGRTALEPGIDAVA